MPHINLLPWREEQRSQRNKDFATTCVVFAVITLMAVGGVHYWFNQRIDWQGARNDLLKGEIAKLDEKIKAIADLDAKREALEARMKNHWGAAG